MKYLTEIFTLQTNLLQDFLHEIKQKPLYTPFSTEQEMQKLAQLLEEAQLMEENLRKSSLTILQLLQTFEIEWPKPQEEATSEA